MSIQPIQLREEQALTLYRQPSLIPGLESVRDEWSVIEFTTLADYRTLLFAQENGIKIKYLPEFRVFTPVKGGEFSEMIRFKLMGPIAREIGKLVPAESEASSLWRNSAKTVDGLILHSREAAPILKGIASASAKEGGGRVEFGPGDQHITKDPVSLARKVQQKSLKADEPPERAVRRIGDAVRGTIIFESPKKMRQAIHKFQDLLARKGMKVVFDNKWIVSRKDGYTGVHAKLLLKTPKGADVIGEIQFHLSDLCDGTSGSPKETAHRLYERIRSSPGPQEEATAASNFMYTAAIGHATVMGTRSQEAQAVLQGRVKGLIETKASG